MLYTLSLNRAICQLYLNKTGRQYKIHFYRKKFLNKIIRYSSVYLNKGREKCKDMVLKMA